jgi:hypothetical protein
MATNEVTSYTKCSLSQSIVPHLFIWEYRRGNTEWTIKKHRHLDTRDETKTHKTKNTENLKDEEHRPGKKPKGESRCDEE